MEAVKIARLVRFELVKVKCSLSKFCCLIICIMGYVDIGKMKILDNI